MKVNNYWKNFPSVDYHWHIIISLTYFLIGIVGFVLNGMSLFYLIRVKTLKRPGTYFLINLAFTDLFKVIFNLPMNIISSFYGKWMFDQIGCNFYGICGGLFGFTSISTMAFMTIERYLIVKNPLFSLKITNKLVFVCIAFTWFYSASWILPQLFSKNQFVLEGFLTSCTFDYISNDLYTRIFMMTMFTGGFLVPLLIIIIFYILIWFLLRTNEMFVNYHNLKKKPIKTNAELSVYYLNKSFDQNNTLLNKTSQNVKYIKTINKKNGTIINSTMVNCEHVYLDTNLTKSPSTQGLNNKSNHSSRTSATNSMDKNRNSISFLRREIKIVKTILLIVIMFCLAWLPYATIAMMAQFGTNIHNYITPFTTSLPSIFAKTSSIYNPIIYTLTNKECRAYFKKIIFTNYFCFKPIGINNKKQKKSPKLLMIENDY